LAGVQFPGDAVGTTGLVTGQLTLRPDGTVAPEASRVTVDLRDLKSDDPRRDGFIKDNTLDVSRFPVAEFVPIRVVGGPSPLPVSGEHAFQLVGQMTTHGVTREQTWMVRARRDVARLTGTATTSVRFGDYGMSIPRVPMVLSIVDEIRLEVHLVANLPLALPHYQKSGARGRSRPGYLLSSTFPALVAFFRASWTLISPRKNLFSSSFTALTTAG
jgi:polyisoprenoid-binding protein YceI